MNGLTVNNNANITRANLDEGTTPNVLCKNDKIKIVDEIKNVISRMFIGTNLFEFESMVALLNLAIEVIQSNANGYTHAYYGDNFCTKLKLDDKSARILNDFLRNHKAILMNVFTHRIGGCMSICFFNMFSKVNYTSSANTLLEYIDWHYDLAKIFQEVLNTDNGSSGVVDFFSQLGVHARDILANKKDPQGSNIYSSLAIINQRLGIDNVVWIIVQNIDSYKQVFSEKQNLKVKWGDIEKLIAFYLELFINDIKNVTLYPKLVTMLLNFEKEKPVKLIQLLLSFRTDDSPTVANVVHDKIDTFFANYHSGNALQQQILMLKSAFMICNQDNKERITEKMISLITSNFHDKIKQFSKIVELCLDHEKTKSNPELEEFIINHLQPCTKDFDSSSASVNCMNMLKNKFAHLILNNHQVYSNETINKIVIILRSFITKSMPKLTESQALHFLHVLFAIILKLTSIGINTKELTDLIYMYWTPDSVLQVPYKNFLCYLENIINPKKNHKSIYYQYSYWPDLNVVDLVNFLMQINYFKYDRDIIRILYNNFTAHHLKNHFKSHNQLAGNLGLITIDHFENDMISFESIKDIINDKRPIIVIKLNNQYNEYVIQSADTYLEYFAMGNRRMPINQVQAVLKETYWTEDVLQELYQKLGIKIFDYQHR